MPTTEYVTLAALAAQYDEDKSNTLRAIRRWEQEVGPRLRMGRAGGGQKKCLLPLQYVDDFHVWREDFPIVDGGVEPTPSLADIADQLSALADTLATVARGLSARDHE